MLYSSPIALRAFLILAAVQLACAAQTRAADPLHVRIDRVADASAIGPRAAIADDLTFVRRIYLDLAGRVPSTTEAREFTASTDVNKRAKLVDRLIASHEFSRNFAVLLDVMLMERRAGKHVTSADLQKWLRAQIDANRPFNEMAADILVADGTPEKGRESAAFILERDVEPNLLTREVGRMFFGVDLQCAQCHDHPLIDDYYQADYYGLFAFVNRTSLYRPDAKKPGLLQESAGTAASFKSVFTDREAITGPRLPGTGEITEPVFLPGNDYKSRPAKNIRGIPAFSRRDKMGELIRTQRNSFFERNIVNRLWALMLGRGLVHPVDQHHSDNPASNPELLNLLCDEFVASKYNVKSLIREIALSNVYQRSYRLPESNGGSATELKQQVAELEQQAAAERKISEEKFTAVEKQLGLVDAAIAAAKAPRVAYAKILKTAEDAAAKRDVARQAKDAKQTALNAKQPIADALRAAATASKAAADALKGDKELTDVFTKLDAKAKKIEAEAAKLKTELAAAVTAADTAEVALTEANKPVVPEQQKFAPLEQKIRDERARLVELRGEMMVHKSKATHLDRRVKLLQALIGVDEAAAEIVRLEQSIKDIQQTQQVNVQAEIAAVQQSMAGLKSTSDVATKAHSAATQQLAAVQQLRQGKAVAQGLLTESVAKANATLAKLPNDVDIKTAVAKLNVAQTNVTSALTEADKQVAAEQAKVNVARTAMDVAVAKLKQAEKQLVDGQTRLAKLGQDVVLATKQIATKRSEVDDHNVAIVEMSSNNFNVAVLEPLSPEQLAWSVLRASGQYDRQLAASKAEIDKKTPLKPEELKDPAKVAQRAIEVDEAAYAKLATFSARFVSLYASQKGQPQDMFFATAEQALFFANGGEVRSWLTPSGTNLTGRLVKLEDSKALAEELYLSVLTRMPNEQEIKNVADYLETQKTNKNTAVAELAWALMTGVEFRFHH